MSRKSRTRSGFDLHQAADTLSMAQCIEIELAAMPDAQRRDRGLEALREPVEPAIQPNVVSISADRAQAMADFSIAYDGVRYYYESYRYDYLDDAVNYAKLQRSRGGRARMPTPLPPMLEGPGDSERRTMTSFGITYEKGVFRLGEFRYDRLEDALAHARSQCSPQAQAGKM